MHPTTTLATGALLTALTLNLTPAAAQYISRDRPTFSFQPRLQTLTLKPDLAWGDRSTYAVEGPSTREFFVEGLGIDDFVTAFGPGVAFDIGQDLINRAGSLDEPYFVNLKIKRMIFRSLPDGNGQHIAGWVSGDDTYTVYEADADGPSLAPGERLRITFEPIDPVFDLSRSGSAACGLFEAILTLDGDATVAETDEQNNRVRHFLYVDSDQLFNLSVPPNRRNVKTRSRANPGYSSIILSPAPGAGTVPILYTNLSVSRSFRARVFSVPAPSPSTVRQLGAPLSIGLNAFFLRGTPKTTMTAKVSVISEDGCLFKQESVNLEYTPPGAVFGAGTPGFTLHTEWLDEAPIEGPDPWGQDLGPWMEPAR